MEELDLATAHPPVELLPSTAQIVEWASSFAGSTGTDVAGYGERSGLGEARIAIAAWLSEAYAGSGWEPSGMELVLCAGVSGAIDACARRLDTWHGDGAPMGNVALVDTDTYELAPPILTAAGLQVDCSDAITTNMLQ